MEDEFFTGYQESSSSWSDSEDGDLWDESINSPWVNHDTWEDFVAGGDQDGAGGTSPDDANVPTPDQIESLLDDYDSEYEDMTEEERAEWNSRNEEAHAKALELCDHEKRESIMKMKEIVDSQETSQQERESVACAMEELRRSVGASRPIHDPQVATYSMSQEGEVLQRIQTVVLSEYQEVYCAIPHAKDCIDEAGGIIPNTTIVADLLGNSFFDGLCTCVWFYRRSVHHGFKILMASNGVLKNVTGSRHLLMSGYSGAEVNHPRRDEWKARATWLSYSVYLLVNDPVVDAFMMGVHPNMLMPGSLLGGLSQDNFMCILEALWKGRHSVLPVPFIGCTSQRIPAIDPEALEKMRQIFTFDPRYRGVKKLAKRIYPSHYILYELDFAWMGGALLYMLGKLLEWTAGDEGCRVFLSVAKNIDDRREVRCVLFTRSVSPCGRRVPMAFRTDSMTADPIEFGVINVYDKVMVDDEDVHDGADSVCDDCGDDDQHEQPKKGNGMPDAGSNREDIAGDRKKDWEFVGWGSRIKSVIGSHPAEAPCVKYNELLMPCTELETMKKYKRTLFVYDGRKVMQHCRLCIDGGISIPFMHELAFERDKYRSMRVSKRDARRWMQESTDAL